MVIPAEVETCAPPCLCVFGFNESNFRYMQCTSSAYERWKIHNHNHTDYGNFAGACIPSNDIKHVTVVLKRETLSFGNSGPPFHHHSGPFTLCFSHHTEPPTQFRCCRRSLLNGWRGWGRGDRDYVRGVFGASFRRSAGAGVPGTTCSGSLAARLL